MAYSGDIFDAVIAGSIDEIIIVINTIIALNIITCELYTTLNFISAIEE